MAAKKRTKEQIRHGRARVAELALQQYTHQEIADIYRQETGIDLSRRMITYDMGRIREAWMKTQHESYHTLIAMEISRLDVLEAEIWRAMREQAKGKEREEIERARRAIEDSDGADYEMVITKTRETFDTVAINPSYFAQIQECQKERRRLLGLYAPKLVDIQKNVVVKGYTDVSPDDWPDAVVQGQTIEGQVIQ